jgi:hypothetical protein
MFSAAAKPRSEYAPLAHWSGRECGCRAEGLTDSSFETPREEFAQRRVYNLTYQTRVLFWIVLALPDMLIRFDLWRILFSAYRFSSR